MSLLINGAILERTFEIVIPEANSGDFTGESTTWIHSLGNGNGKNGTRTVGGTIVLDSLIVPTGVTVDITTTDIDLTRDGNQGYLPAIILVAGAVDIQGILGINGTDGETGGTSGVNGGGGGDGGPGGGGGGSSGTELTVGINPGGDGFSGGGGGAAGNTGTGGDGGDGTGALGTPQSGGDGGEGGTNLYGNTNLGGQGGVSHDTNAGSAGAGGSGDPFGTQATAGINNPRTAGNGGGAGAGISGFSSGGGGGGFGTAGTDGGVVGGSSEPGDGGLISGNTQLVPFSGGSGGGGGSPDDNNSNARAGGGAAGGAGAVVIYAEGILEVSGTLEASGGIGGDHNAVSNGGGGGGGGSGGAVILQSSNVTTSVGTWNAVGGAGGDGQGAADGGTGGDGRIRVDGLPQGIAAIEGTINGAPIPFVGPAITVANTTGVIGTAAAGADIEAKIWNGTHFNSFTTTADGVTGDYALSVTYYPGANYITVIQNTTGDTESVMSSAALWTLHAKSTEDDSASTDDSISFKVFISIEDGLRGDSLTIDDFIDKVIVQFVEDSATISDSISKRVFYSIFDTTLIDEFISAKSLIRLADGSWNSLKNILSSISAESKADRAITLSMKSSIVNESPLSPSSIVMNALNEIESSIVAESSTN